VGSLTTARKKRRGVTSCKRTNGVAVKSSFPVNNERKISREQDCLPGHKIETLARNIGGPLIRDTANSDTRNTPGCRDLSRATARDTDDLLESGHPSLRSFRRATTRSRGERVPRARARVGERAEVKSHLLSAIGNIVPWRVAAPICARPYRAVTSSEMRDGECKERKRRRRSKKKREPR